MHLKEGTDKSKNGVNIGGSLVKLSSLSDVEVTLRCLGNSEKAELSQVLFVTLLAGEVGVGKGEEKTLSLSLSSHHAVHATQERFNKAQWVRIR